MLLFEPYEMEPSQPLPQQQIERVVSHAENVPFVSQTVIFIDCQVSCFESVVMKDIGCSMLFKARLIVVCWFLVGVQKSG